MECCCSSQRPRCCPCRLRFAMCGAVDHQVTKPKTASVTRVSTFISARTGSSTCTPCSPPPLGAGGTILFQPIRPLFSLSPFLHASQPCCCSADRKRICHRSQQHRRQQSKTPAADACLQRTNCPVEGRHVCIGVVASVPCVHLFRNPPCVRGRQAPRRGEINTYSSYWLRAEVA